MGSGLRIGVLALQGDFREHLHAVEAAGAAGIGVRRPAELDGLDGLIIPGGESTTIDKLARIFELRDPLRERIRAGLPVYGSCAGMILLAEEIADPATDLAGNPQQTFGGLDITVRRNAFGRQRESFETDLDFKGLEFSADGRRRGPGPRRLHPRALGGARRRRRRSPGPGGTVQGRPPGIPATGRLELLQCVPASCWPPPSTRK